MHVLHVLNGKVWQKEDRNRAGHNIVCSPQQNPIPQWLQQWGQLTLERMVAECAPPALEENSFCKVHNYAMLISNVLR